MIELDASQAAALELVLEEPIAIVTGGPGTGKTTILKAALDELEARGLDVALCAPTGKAAKRMSEATKREAKTIHRILRWFDGVFFFDEENPLTEDVVIVDEASMIDVELFASLLAAIDPRRTRLVLVGDANQLPSVGPGAILADLVRTELVPCARLTTVHRSAAGSWVCRNAPRVLEGVELELEEAEDFRFVEAESPGNVLEACGDVLEERADAMILVPQKTRGAGTQAINVAAQARFNPRRPGELEWGTDPHRLRPRDRVIHTKNNYDLDVFNGETGIVESISKRELAVRYPDRGAPVIYDREAARALCLAYALTIHKSQGSEWSDVAVVVHSAHTFMLTRQLLYTAITRAKRSITIIGNDRGIANALKCKRDARRNTALAARIRGEL